MGRGGDGVGGNWRGVALTHQATAYKNKTCGQGNGTVFFLFFFLNTSSPYTKRTAEITKHDICFISGINLPHSVMLLLAYLSLIQVSLVCSTH